MYNPYLEPQHSGEAAHRSQPGPDRLTRLWHSLREKLPDSGDLLLVLILLILLLEEDRDDPELLLTLGLSLLP